MSHTSLPLRQQLLAAVLCVFVVASFECAAQDGAPDLAEATIEQLGNIKVYSASKRLQAASDAPSSVTVITADDIQQHGYRTLADVLQSVRGFFVTDDRNYSSLGVRGFARPGDFNTRILLLVDGHRLNDNIYDEAMIGTEFPIDIALVERIEVIRGPVSSLYGSNALFAVINVITKRGKDLGGLELWAEAASLNTYAGRISYGQKLRQFDFLLSGTFYGSRGYDQLFFPEFNKPETNNGIASHADDTQLGNSLATIHFRDFTLQSAFGTREKGVPTAPYGTLFNNPGTRTTDSHTYIDLRFDHTFARSWNILARTFYDRYTYAGTYIYSSSGNSAAISPNLDVADGKWWGGELQLSKMFPAHNQITAGTEYRDNFRQDQTNYNLNPYSLLLNDKRTSAVAAVYLEDEVTLPRSLILNFGFRYDHYNILDTSADPRAALIYRPWSHTAFKGIYSEAFRAPNVYELYYSVLPNLPSPDLKPEKLRSTEFVWEQGITSHLWLSTSAFCNWIGGLITEEPVDDNAVRFRNLQNARSAGLELEIQGQLPKGLEGSASYSFQETKDRVTGQFLSNSPRGLGKLSLSQSLLGKRMFASMDAQYRSRIQGIDGDTVSPFTVVNFTLLGRGIGKHLDLSGSIYNLLDKRYFDPPSIANLQNDIQQDGRSFRITMMWHSGER